jgi:epoxyqueuosine reductase
VNRWNPELRRWLQEASRAAGFDDVGVCEVRAPDSPSAAQEATRFATWIDAGHAGEMEYLKRRDEQGTLVRGNLRIAMPWARSAIVCAMNYNFTAPSMRNEVQAASPLSIDPAPSASGWIARYAWTGSMLEDGASTPTDYHEELLARLRHLESGLLVRADCTTRCYVDTGPLVERAFAAEAGVGWIGKNTCLLNQQLGSWLLLCVIVTSLPVGERMREHVEDAHSADTPPGSLLLHSEQLLTTQIKHVIPKHIASIPAVDRCGTCTRCIDACPTGALLGSKSPDAPRTMDASRCIAYLTIEKKGAIDPSLRAPMGRHVFGCDICQDVCPWNRKASIAENEIATVSSTPRPVRNGWDSMRPRSELINPALDWLAALDASQYKQLFKGSPLERTGRKRLLRNVAIAMGNSGEARFLPQLEAWAAGDDPVLADAAAWARARLLAL